MTPGTLSPVNETISLGVISFPPIFEPLQGRRRIAGAYGGIGGRR